MTGDWRQLEVIDVISNTTMSGLVVLIVLLPLFCTIEAVSLNLNESGAQSSRPNHRGTDGLHIGFQHQDPANPADPHHNNATHNNPTHDNPTHGDTQHDIPCGEYRVVMRMAPMLGYFSMMIAIVISILGLYIKKEDIIWDDGTYDGTVTDSEEISQLDGANVKKKQLKQAVQAKIKQKMAKKINENEHITPETMKKLQQRAKSAVSGLSRKSGRSSYSDDSSDETPAKRVTFGV